MMIFPIGIAKISVAQRSLAFSDGVFYYDNSIAQKQCCGK